MLLCVHPQTASSARTCTSRDFGGNISPGDYVYSRLPATVNSISLTITG
jgi:hypothetical protein